VVPLQLLLPFAFSVVLVALPMAEPMGGPSMPVPGADRGIVLAAALYSASVVLGSRA
jgi:hypothetical protein